MFNLKFKNKTFRYVGTYINRRPGADSILPHSILTGGRGGEVTGVVRVRSGSLGRGTKMNEK